MATFDDVKRTAKELALLQHQDDTDEMLQETVKRNGAQILSNNGLSDADMSLKARLSGEVDGCVEIFQYRQKAREEIKEKAKKWHARLPERKAKAILNLPNAASPNGQLVAAILEETPDGLTQKQLANWCDELSAIPEEELKSLLDGLVEEKIIELGKHKHYRLLNVLDEDMRFSVPYLRSVLKDQNDGVKLLWSFLSTQKDPICIQDINKLLGVQNNKIKDMNAEFNGFEQLCFEGLAQRAYLQKTGPAVSDYRTYYAPRLLGEVDAE